MKKEGDIYPFSLIGDNQQYWIGAKHRQDFGILSDKKIEIINTYTPLFIDFVDNYNESIEKGTQPVNRCPDGGAYDGSNCYIGSPPSGESAFIYNEIFYYTPIGCCSCPQSGTWYDGANCFKIGIPNSSIGFINNNEWYLYPHGDIKRPYDQITGYTMGDLENDVVKHSYGLSSLKNNLKSNKPSGVTNKMINFYFDYFFNL